MRKHLKTLLVLGFLCSAISFFISLTAVTFTETIRSLNNGKPSWSRSLAAVDTKKPIYIQANAKYRYLLNHAIKLLNSSSKFTDGCGIKPEPVDFSQTFGTNVTYKLLVPAWLSGPRKPPYYITSIVRLRLYAEDKARWSRAELKQWVHYQLWAGAEHVYICNHFLKPEERFEKDFVEYSRAGLVTVIDWAHIEAVPGSSNYEKQNEENQVGCYNYVKRKWGHLSTWMYTLDMDENPYCPQDRCEGFLKRFLENADRGQDKKVGVYLLANYVLHGQGDRSRDIHYDRINRITPRPPDGNVKSIFRVNWTEEAGMHDVMLFKGMTVYPKPTELKMLHYWGSRSQQWGPDTKAMLAATVEFNDVRETIAVGIRHSLLAFGEFEAFSNSTGP